MSDFLHSFVGILLIGMAEDELSQEQSTFLALQKDCLKRLKSELTNHNKAGADRQNKRHFLSRIQKIESNRIGFLQRHAEIIQSEFPDTHEYLVDNFIEKYEEEHLHILSIVQTALDAVAPLPVTVPLSSSHKFPYLKGALSLNVKSLIGYLNITAENYGTAWNALITRYNNKRALFGNYMDKRRLLMNQPTICKNCTTIHVHVFSR